MAAIERDSRTFRWGLSTVGIVLFFFAWYALTDLTNVINIAGFTSPMAVLTRFMETRSVVLSNVWPTFKVAIVGFIAAVGLGFLTAVTLTASERVRDALLPLIVGGNSVPRVTLAPLIIFYISGISAKYIIAAWIAFFPFTINAMEGMGIIEEDLENLLASLDSTLFQEFRYVRFPNALPFIFDGMKIAVPASIVGAVVGEFVSAQSGLGYLALFALVNLDIEMAFATVMIAGFISLFAFYTLFILQSRIVHWKETGFFTEE